MTEIQIGQEVEEHTSNDHGRSDSSDDKEDAAKPLQELVLVLKIAAPTLFIQLFQCGMWTASSLGSARLGTDQLAAFSLAMLTANVVG